MFRTDDIDRQIDMMDGWWMDGQMDDGWITMSRWVDRFGLDGQIHMIDRWICDGWMTRLIDIRTDDRQINMVDGWITRDRWIGRYGRWMDRQI